MHLAHGVTEEVVIVIVIIDRATTMQDIAKLHK